MAYFRTTSNHALCYTCLVMLKITVFFMSWYALQVRSASSQYCTAILRKAGPGSTTLKFIKFWPSNSACLPFSCIFHSTIPVDKVSLAQSWRRHTTRQQKGKASNPHGSHASCALNSLRAPSALWILFSSSHTLRLQLPTEHILMRLAFAAHVNLVNYHPLP